MCDVEGVIKKRKPDFIIMPSFEVFHPQENCFKIMAKEVTFKGRGNSSVGTMLASASGSKLKPPAPTQTRPMSVTPAPGGPSTRAKTCGTLEATDQLACTHEWAPGSVRNLSRKLRWEVCEETSGIGL